MADRTPTIAGIGLSDYPIAPHLNSEQHQAQALQRALVDSGLSLSDIDGLFCPGDAVPHAEDAVNTAEYLGIRPRYLDSTFTGGSAFEVLMQHAALAIRAGACEVALIVYGSDTRSRGRRKLGAKGLAPLTYPPSYVPDRFGGPVQYEVPYGPNIISSYALAAQRHMFEFGTTSEQLAEIAVAMRHNAGFNPDAMNRDPITVDDVLSSRMMADPLHKLDCCVVSDGGGAILVTTADRAKDLRQPPVFVLGAAAAGNHWNINAMDDFTTTAAARCGPEAFAAAGITPSDVDTVQVYDSFTITVLLQLEDLGFCKKGEGGPFVADGKLRVGGALPTNTDGGGLSSCHPGMRGIFLLIEAARQLRGQAGEAQVPDCDIAVASGSGGMLSHLGVVVMGREHDARRHG